LLNSVVGLSIYFQVVEGLNSSGVVGATSTNVPHNAGLVGFGELVSHSLPLPAGCRAFRCNYSILRGLRSS
jgi:hypothetical protein